MKIVYVECKPDHTLARKLLHKDADIVHSGNKPGVIRALLKERQGCHKEVVGMIDDDPDSPQPALLKSSFMDDQRFESLQHLYVKTLKGCGKEIRLIVIKENLEDWILKASGECRVDVEKFGLSKSVNWLHAIINSKLNLFEQLIDELIDKKCKRLEELGQVLNQ